ncbi:MAG: ABC transporter ATP-binding protein, partial [Bacilli bacterium]|nr:ABC transporter ATP-binding protein [Bacilli bacterium]
MFRRFIAYYKPYKRLFILDMLASFLISIIGMGYPVLTRYVLNDIVPNEELDDQNKIIQIVIIGSALLLIYIIRMLLRYFVQYKGHVMGVKMQADMRRDMFKKIQQLPFSYYDENETGKIMSRMTNDLQDVSELAHHGPENLFISGMSLIVSFVYLMFIEWRFALILLLSIPLMVVVSIFTRKQMRKAFTETRKSIAQINASTESSISGIRVTKAFNNSEKEIAKFEESNKSYVEARSRAYKKMGQFQSSTMFITDLFNALLLSVGGILVVLGTGNFNLASYISFVVTVGLFINPLTTLINFVEQYQNGVTGFKRFIEIMDEPVESEDENPFEKERLNGDIEFKHVNFDYDTTKGVLNDVSFKIKEGEKVAFV